MPLVYNLSSRSIQYQVDGGTIKNGSRTAEVRATRTPNLKQVGTFISVPGSTGKFRSATPLSKSVAWIESKTPEDTEYHQISNPANKCFDRTSPGGYRPDLLFDPPFSFGLEPEVDTLLGGPGVPQGMRNECETKALLDLANSKANIGETLATLRQTVGLLKNPIGTFIKELRKLKANHGAWAFNGRARRDFNRGELLTPYARTYLAYVYGWKPLMQDIHGIIELAQETSGLPLLMNSRGTSKRGVIHKDISNNAISYGITTKTNSVSSKSHARCSLWAVPDPNWTGTRTLNQLNLLNPASLAWELVPASFIVDWFLPIGPVLQALTAPAGLSFVNGSTSNRVSARFAYSQGATLPSGYRFTKENPSTGLCAYEGYSRVVLDNWPRPGFWFDPDPLRLKQDGSDRIFKFLALSLLQMKSR